MRQRLVGGCSRRRQLQRRRQQRGHLDRRAGDSGGSGDSGDSGGIAKADVPVGGGTIVAATKTVVTQPAAGEFKAFSSICTHMGCPVAPVADGTINCNCHGSRFDIATGAVKRGPATRPLPAKTVTVKGDRITVT